MAQIPPPRSVLKIIGLALLSIASLAMAGAFYQRVAFRLDTQRSPRPRQLVSAGDFKINVHCSGKGTPTVVLESGLGDSMDSWIQVQPEIAKFARVCSYDRAGYGYSDQGPMPRTSERIASELHAALRSAGESPPYLLAGHSFGGYSVRVFNRKYPGEVSGLVLIDAVQEDQYRLLPKGWLDLAAAVRERARRQAFWSPVYIGLGIARLELWLHGRQAPPVLLQSSYIRARASELLNIEVSAEQARAAGHMGDKPLVVLTAGRPVDRALEAVLSPSECNAFQKTWIDDLQPRLARLSSRGTHRIVPDSGHDIPSERPDAIVSAVRDLCVSGL